MLRLNNLSHSFRRCFSVGCGKTYTMPSVNLKFISGVQANEEQVVKHPLTIIGQVGNLRQAKFEDFHICPESKVTEQLWKCVMNSLNPSPTETYHFGSNAASIGTFSDKYSRHSTPSGAYNIPKLLRNCMCGKGDERVVIVCKESELVACGCAIARTYPLFSMRNVANRGSTKITRTVRVHVVVVGERTCSMEHIVSSLNDISFSVRMAAQIVDMPCNFMNTTAFVNEACTVAQDLGIKPTVIKGEELKTRGFGGIYGVGKASTEPPALVVLSHRPAGATKTIAWCGKGIVYDTGGLSIKGKTTMPGMKRDCGGAAAILYAFHAAVKRGFKQNLHAVLCLAENSVGPIATRPDDIHVLYSGKSVEINNTDAEGRLVLGDGVAYAGKDLKADIILDMATLTGAQGVCTGKYHAALLCNRENWEKAVVEAGISSADLVYPIVYCPELHFSEFSSAVADMKNSVADRSNAQSSCAGLFIASHLPNSFLFPGTWIHVDMAGPSHCGERATGYGVALLLAAFGQESKDPLLNLIAPGKIEDESGDGLPNKRSRHK